MSDRAGTVTYMNDQRINFTGRDLATGYEDAWSAFVHPDDLQSVQAANKHASNTSDSFPRSTGFEGTMEYTGGCSILRRRG